ncbi:hypothetical protein KP509_13G017500 [Ceratopteris richardii]|uniref:GDSL esterase/lipase n=1 Tax=Ceratopteris richardii TaxID=49495 RepID=A0A8T2TFT1_CERRI|nr:hypothetical protein KP509_13G017500 [Ceratopteris richardii]KAH7420694.1 hypothetical protein KP509_13G017500 [Ceratopteris richardii]
MEMFYQQMESKGKMFTVLTILLLTSRNSGCGIGASAGTRIADLPRNADGDVALANFIFGDSLVDVGNNNYLPLSLATAKNLPNGIDFPQRNGRTPTGRFSNGRTIPDILVLKVGSKHFPPPYLSPTAHGSAILGGVNYASGGGGILNNTGRIFVQRISMDVQISYFERTLEELRELLGPTKTSEMVTSAIFSVTMGSNDFLDNYLSPVPDTLDPILLPPPEFIRLLITTFESQLTRLYDNGARKLIIVNLPAIGCIPYQRSLQVGRHGICSARANKLASEFNVPLKEMLDRLNRQLTGATFLYADAYSIMLDIVNNYENYGLENADTACCGAFGSKRGIIPCRSFLEVCKDRSKFFFWDPYHPSEAGYQIIAAEFFDGNRYISPMNVRQLIEL